MVDTSTSDAVELAAREAGLIIVGPDDLTFSRRKAGEGFIFLRADGKPVKDKRLIKRFQSLAIPPAYEDVRLAPNARAHLQATGRDAAGRVQYRYHPKWDRVRESMKVERLDALLRSLPAIRRRVSQDLSRRTLDRQKALAAGVALLDATHMRIGCDRYAKANKSFGVSTLMKHHVEVGRNQVALRFRGKGGKDISCCVESPRLARALARLMELPGRRLLKYRRQGKAVGVIRAEDINDYLSEIAGRPVTAKDLRALGACAAAAEKMVKIDPAESESQQRRQIASVMKDVSERLANTPAIVRKSYVHAVVVDGFVSGDLQEAYDSARARSGVRRVEKALKVLVDQHKASLLYSS
ncbi:DNA topoisomerase I [Agaricicola taiwanensis]|uniref:DNA topoisomerase I n=1 Tax=Agaricicola taiwanensis TaxID=591372 RepID=A0A8J2YEM7_9RHOB|nr:DNA topoisomerase IB [Agaricicola taiwanensis]GGE37772.1 DNA topoisomerase I [Agaricicola taiwanensis]